MVNAQDVFTGIIYCAALGNAIITVGVLWASKWEEILMSFKADWAPVMRLDGTNCLGYDLI